MGTSRFVVESRDRRKGPILADWYGELDPAVQTAVIAAIATLLAAVVAAVSTATSVWLNAHFERKAEASRTADAQRTTYRRYAEPLTSAATSLYWRLREILELGIGHYLAEGGGATRYEAYKVLSTQYRLAALLGWIAALRRELVLIDATADPSISGLRDAVSRVESALAEGGHVELARVEILAELWGLGLSPDDSQRLGSPVNAVMKRHLHEAGAITTAALDDSDRELLAIDLARCVHKLTSIDVDTDVARRTSSDVARALSIREAWLYRDWQQAIGDVMLDESPGGSRRFEVRGFRAFERMADNPTHKDAKWLRRLCEVFDGLSLDGDTRNDARVAMLRSVLVATASLVDDFHKAEPERSGVEARTLTAVRATLSAGHQGSSHSAG